MPNITLTKTLSAVSSTAVGSISSAATPVVTLNTSNYSTQRRLSLWSSVALSSTWVLTITGTREGGATITESIIPSTVAGTPNVTVQDFLSVRSVSFTNSTSNVSVVNIGLSSIGSTPWQVANTCATPFNIGFNLTYASSNATTSAEVDYTGQDIGVIFGPATAMSSFVPLNFSISTAISTTGVSTAGKIDFPVTAWRLTVNTTNSSATSGVTLFAVPTGLGS
jgi:hypothetical protein